ncbi:rho GTPase-activating protein 22 [Pelomyxa schiedti]|nr:rho GTPase-activating protein 22 [Pelomyxa schiedti]
MFGELVQGEVGVRVPIDTGSATTTTATTPETYAALSMSKTERYYFALATRYKVLKCTKTDCCHQSVSMHLSLAPNSTTTAIAVSSASQSPTSSTRRQTTIPSHPLPPTPNAGKVKITTLTEQPSFANPFYTSDSTKPNPVQEEEVIFLEHPSTCVTKPQDCPNEIELVYFRSDKVCRMHIVAYDKSSFDIWYSKLLNCTQTTFTSSSSKAPSNIPQFNWLMSYRKSHSVPRSRGNTESPPLTQTQSPSTAPSRLKPVSVLHFSNNTPWKDFSPTLPFTIDLLKLPQQNIFGVNLPMTIVVFIFGFLGPTDLAKTTQVCSAWHCISELPCLWAYFCTFLGLDYSTSPQYKQTYIDFQVNFQVGREHDKAKLYGSFFQPAAKFPETCKAGWLLKQGEDILKMFKRRFFVLYNHCLCYYKSNEHVPQGMVPLTSDIRIKNIKKTSFVLSSAEGGLKTWKSKGYAAPISSTRGECLIAADSPAVLSEWLEYLAANLRLSFDLEGTTRTVYKQIFGVPLDTVMSDQRKRYPHSEIPLFLYNAFQQLSLRGLQEEGIFRISGCMTELQLLKSSLEQARTVNLANFDVHTLTNLVKSYLRELPQPLIPSQISNTITQLMEDNSKFPHLPESVLQSMKNSLFTLPPNNLALIRHLSRILKQVVDHSAENKMNTHTLLLVFVPSLRCSPAALAVCVDYHDFMFPS